MSSRQKRKIRGATYPEFDRPNLDLSKEGLKWLRRHFWPGGSGALYKCRVIVLLVEELAKAKGWNLDE